MTISSSKKNKKGLNNGHWSFEEQLDYEEAIGFIYLIYCSRTGMAYLGKKNFKGNGKKNKGVQSNWKVYTGSSKSLNADIEKYGKEAFEFYVLEQYYTRSGFSWAETWSQVHVEVPCNNHLYYNRFIDKTMWKVTEPVTARHKRRLKELTKGLG